MDTKENKSASSAKKNSAVLEHIEQVVEDIENILNTQKNSPDRENQLKGVLFYWLGIMFEDGAMDAENLKNALDISRALTKRLKISNDNLKLQIKKNLAEDEEI